MDTENNRLKLAEWNMLQTRLLWVYQNHVPVVGCCENASGLNYSVWFIHEGCVTLKAGNQKRRTIPQGHWVIPPVSISRSQFFPRQTRITSINFIAEWPGARYLIPCDQIISFAEGSRIDFEKSTRQLIKSVLPYYDLYSFGDTPSMTYDAYIDVSDSFLNWLKAWLTVMKSFDHSPTHTAQLDSRLSKALFVLDSLPFDDRDFYSRLNQAMGLGRTQIDRLFRANLSTTPKKYMEQRILRALTERLRLTTQSVKELADEFGFASSAHLCTWFKRQTGYSPKNRM